MIAPWYATREQVKEALDVAESARANRQVDRLLAASSRHIERMCHRRFYPQVASRSFAWPNEQMGTSWRFWLDDNELVSATTITSGGVAVADYFLEPQASGPPYNRVELDLSGSDSFGGGATHQRDLTIVGVFGYGDDETPGGALAEALDATETEVDVTDAAAVGVGDLIRVDTERMVVTGRTQVTTGQTLGANLTAQLNAQSVSVSDGTGFAVGEMLLIDAERMVIDDIAGNTLVVRRAQDGSTLAAHTTGATIYAPRRLTVARGACGTTAAIHSTAAAVAVHAPPAPVRALAVAETLWALQQEASGYARVIGSGESTRQASASGIKVLRAEVRDGYARQARKRAI